MFPHHRHNLHTAGIRSRRKVAKHAWPYMFSIGLAYFVTLCLFPGIESEVVSCRLHSWMPVILIAIFNLFDFIGKVGQSNSLGPWKGVICDTRHWPILKIRQVTLASKSWYLHWHVWKFEIDTGIFKKWTRRTRTPHPGPSASRGHQSTKACLCHSLKYKSIISGHGGMLVPSYTSVFVLQDLFIIPVEFLCATLKTHYRLSRDRLDNKFELTFYQRPNPSFIIISSFEFPIVERST